MPRLTLGERLRDEPGAAFDTSPVVYVTFLLPAPCRVADRACCGWAGGSVLRCLLGNMPGHRVVLHAMFMIKRVAPCCSGRGQSLHSVDATFSVGSRVPHDLAPTVLCSPSDGDLWRNWRLARLACATY